MTRVLAKSKQSVRESDEEDDEQNEEESDFTESNENNDGILRNIGNEKNLKKIQKRILALMKMIIDIGIIHIDSYHKHLKKMSRIQVNSKVLQNHILPMKFW